MFRRIACFGQFLCRTKKKVVLRRAIFCSDHLVRHDGLDGTYSRILAMAYGSGMLCQTPAILSAFDPSARR